MKEKITDKYHDCGHRPRNTDKRKRRMAKVKEMDNKPLQESEPIKRTVHGQGWECPRCHTIHAPTVSRCLCVYYHQPWIPAPQAPPYGWVPFTPYGYEVVTCANTPPPDCQTICMH